MLDALYNGWGIGQKGKDRGVLVLLAVQDRKYYINVGYGLEADPPGRQGRRLWTRSCTVPAARRLRRRGKSARPRVSLTSSPRMLASRLTTSQPRRIEPLTSAPRKPDYLPGAIIAIIIVIIIVLAVPPCVASCSTCSCSVGGGGGVIEAAAVGVVGLRWGGGFGGFGGGSTGGGGAGGSW